MASESPQIVLFMVTCVSRQFSGDSDVALTGFKAVDGADVVQASTGHVVSRRSIGTGHHPRGAQRNGMNLKKQFQKGGRGYSNIQISSS